MNASNRLDKLNNLSQTMTREDFSKKIAEETTTPREKIAKMTGFSNDHIIDTATYRDSTLRNILLRKSNKLIEGILALSNATNKTRGEILQALQIDNKQFGSMPGIQETIKICQDIKYIYEESGKLKDDIVSLDLSDEQLENENNAQQFMLRYTNIQRYAKDNLLSIEQDKDSRSAMRVILCNGPMIINSIVGIELLISNNAKTIRDIVNGIVYIRNGFEGIYNDEKFKLLAE